MKVRILSATAGLGLVLALAAWGQTPGSPGSTPTAKLGWDPVQLIMPERYQVVERAARADDSPVQF